MYGEDEKYEIRRPITAERKKANWDMASGLQAVDGLEVSDYAQDVAGKYIRGEYTSAEAVQDVLNRNYGEDARQREADVSSMRMSAILESSGKRPFRFEPDELRRLHAQIFDGALEHPEWVGRYRTESIYKREPVLGGRTVDYVEPAEILPALKYHFDNDGTGLRDPETGEVDVGRLSTFVARIWEVHPFWEGNTRTVAVFSQLLLQNLGIPASNEVFKEGGRWYRDALVRASYNSIREGIDADQSHLELFYGRVVSGTEQNCAAGAFSVRKGA